MIKANSNKVNYIDKVIEKISWKTIEDYYKTNNIQWTFNTAEGNQFKRFPNIEDLKADFLNAVNLIISRNLQSMDYGNWLIFWTNEEVAKNFGLPSAQLEALFVLTGGLVNNKGSKSSEEISLTDLNEKMEMALEEEDYILAGQIKKQIEQIENKNKENE